MGTPKLAVRETTRIPPNLHSEFQELAPLNGLSRYNWYWPQNGWGSFTLLKPADPNGTPKWDRCPDLPQVEKASLEAEHLKKIIGHGGSFPSAAMWGSS